MPAVTHRPAARGAAPDTTRSRGSPRPDRLVPHHRPAAGAGLLYSSDGAGRQELLSFLSFYIFLREKQGSRAGEHLGEKPPRPCPPPPRQTPARRRHRRAQPRAPSRSQLRPTPPAAPRGRDAKPSCGHPIAPPVRPPLLTVSPSNSSGNRPQHRAAPTRCPGTAIAEHGAAGCGCRCHVWRRTRASSLPPGRAWHAGSCSPPRRPREGCGSAPGHRPPCRGGLCREPPPHSQHVLGLQS